MRFPKETSSNGTAKGSTHDQVRGPGAQASIACSGRGGWGLRCSRASGLQGQLLAQAPVPPKTTPAFPKKDFLAASEEQGPPLCWASQAHGEEVTPVFYKSTVPLFILCAVATASAWRRDGALEHSRGENLWGLASGPPCWTRGAFFQAGATEFFWQAWVTGRERAASLVSFELQREADVQGSLSPSHSVFQASSEGCAASAQRQSAPSSKDTPQVRGCVRGKPRVMLLRFRREAVFPAMLLTTDGWPLLWGRGPEGLNGAAILFYLPLPSLFLPHLIYSNLFSSFIMFVLILPLSRPLVFKITAETSTPGSTDEGIWMNQLRCTPSVEGWGGLHILGPFPVCIHFPCPCGLDAQPHGGWCSVQLIWWAEECPGGRAHLMTFTVQQAGPSWEHSTFRPLIFHNRFSDAFSCRLFSIPSVLEWGVHLIKMTISIKNKSFFVNHTQDCVI